MAPGRALSQAQAIPGPHTLFVCFARLYLRSGSATPGIFGGYNVNASVHQKTRNRFIEVEYKVPDPSHSDQSLVIRKKFNGLSAKAYDRACARGYLEIFLLPRYGHMASSPRDMWYQGSRGAKKCMYAVSKLSISTVLAVAFVLEAGKINYGAGVLGLIGFLLLDIACFIPIYWYYRRNYLYGGNVIDCVENEPELEEEP